MKIIAPDYYSRFKCIAGACKHSCCIGWEIDIDEDTLARYGKVSGVFGEELRSNIEPGDPPHFRLGEQERCPFLDRNNLCRIIINLGEDALCGICADHPRFRNFFSNRTEIGLGFCCEAAAGLILNWPDPVSLTVLEDDGDTDGGDPDSQFLDTRDSIISILQNRSLDFRRRAEGIMNFAGGTLPTMTPAEWAGAYSSLERLDEQWDAMLNALSGTTDFTSVLSDTQLEQLTVYFIYRHLPDCIYDGHFRERVLFAVLSTRIIDAICALTGCSGEEIARMYSAEIEYSDENIEILLDKLSRKE